MTLSHRILQGKLAQPFRFCQSVDSTNDLAKTWLLDGASEGAVVIADEQRRGRGRRGRAWYTPPGVALALSVILRPSETRVALVNMVGALSVYDLARQVGCDEVSIKWPNDVLVNGKKVSGILVENVWERNKLVGVVLGIGINIRADFRGTGLENAAISLEDVGYMRLDRAELIRKLLQRVDHWYLTKADDVITTWKSRLNTLGNRVTVEGITGIALDVTSAGALLIREDDGEMRQVYAAGISEIGGGRSAS